MTIHHTIFCFLPQYQQPPKLSKQQKQQYKADPLSYKNMASLLRSNQDGDEAITSFYSASYKDGIKQKKKEAKTGRKEWDVEKLRDTYNMSNKTRRRAGL